MKKSMKLKYPDGTKKARMQSAVGHGGSSYPAGSEAWKKAKKEADKKHDEFHKLPEAERVKKLNSASSSQTTKAAVEATDNVKTSNKKLEAYSETNAKKQEKEKEENKKKTTKASAFKKKGAMKLKGKC